jgi:raffinose/stachyose/melibiose transport system permease protein
MRRTAAPAQDLLLAPVRLLGQLLKWLFLIFILLITLAPMIWIILSSLKTNTEIFTSTFSLPKVLQIENYREALALDGLSNAFINTIIVSALSTAFSLLAAAMASYALTYKFRFQRPLSVYLILGMYIPFNAFLVPYLVIIAGMHLLNTRWALIIIYAAVGLPMAILILKGYMDTIPRELTEAAIVDGCGFNQTFQRIIVPLSVPGLATIGIFQFIFAWNEFLFAMIMTTDKYSRTLQISIRFFMGAFITNYAALFATMVICLIPSIVAYVLFQEQIIAGLTSGALKA